MHIAAMSPIALDEKSIPDSVINNEKNIYEEQVSKLNKPKEIATKMIEGKLKKFYEENVLLKQTFVIDNKSTVEEAILAFNKTNNSDIKLLSFTRFSI
jgi:elongation factor Ts